MTTANSRTAEHDISPIFLERWSPRAFTGESISEGELRTLFDAAHWAPSSFNSQPWRFIYARRDNAHWDKFLGLLTEFNRSWAKAASAIVFIVSSETFIPPGKLEPAALRTHAFDAGAAWGYLALQASLSGWAAHGVAGIEWDKINEALNVPKGFTVQAGIIIGKQGPKESLPEGLQAREKPSDRQPVSELAFEGGF
jgi:nitroreductase